jgi:polysaccharide biosynthesis transport protein
LSSLVKRENPETPARPPVYFDLGRSDDDAVRAVRQVCHKLWEKKHYVVLVFLIVLVPAGIGTMLTTPMYRSTALVQVNPDPVQVLPYRDIADSGSAGINFENYMGTQEQLLRGASLRARVSGRLQADLKEDAAASEAPSLGERFDVRKIEKSQLFELSYEATSPQAAATVVNLYAEEFVKHNFEMRQNTRLSAEQRLKEELGALEARLQVSENVLMRYAQTNDILSLEQGQVDPLQQRLSSLTQQVVDAEGSVAVAKSSFESAQNSSAKDFPQRLVSAEISQLEGRVSELEQELASLRTRYGDGWLSVVEKRNQLTLVREQLLQEKSAALARHREQARLDLAGAEGRRRMIGESLEQQKTLVNQFHEASIKYNILKRDVETNRNLYEGLLERLRQTGVLAGLQFGNILVVEPGRPIDLVDSPKVGWTLGIAALLGLALGVVLVILWHFWDTSISSLEDAEELVPMATLGCVPLIKGSQLPGLLSSSLGGSPMRSLVESFNAPEPDRPPLPFELAESLAGICASILLSRSDERPRVLVVTSALPGEGKTTLTAHLGVAFAESGLKTLLVEADLRKADLSRAFAIGKEEGLSLYLAGLVSPSPKIHGTQTKNLYIAAGGPAPPNPAALLHSDRLTGFLARVASEYQVVILDAPPVLSMADARILGTKADGVVLVVRAERTARHLVRRASVLLESTGTNVLGLVVNGWRPSRSERSHYRYYNREALSA